MLRSQFNINISFTTFLLLRHTNVSLRPFNGNERSSEGKRTEEKRFSGAFESVFEHVDARRQLALSLLSLCRVWHITLTAIHSAVLPEMTASSNYADVRQPCSLCCFFNKRSLLCCTEDCTIHCRDHLGLSKSPSQFTTYELFTWDPLREAVCGFEKLKIESLQL